MAFVRRAARWGRRIVVTPTEDALPRPSERRSGTGTARPPERSREMNGVFMLRSTVVGALAVAFALVVMVSGSGAPAAASDRSVGWRAKVGNGDVVSFAE